MNITTSDAAHAAWRSRHDTPTLTLGMRSRDDIGPFKKIGEDLGEGGNGKVYRTELGGVPVALKITRPFRTKEREEFLKEMHILQRISKERHKHVIQYVGGFELHGQTQSKVGLLIWPVAQCNLKEYLDDLDVVARLKTRLAAQSNYQGNTWQPSWEEEAAVGTIYAVTSTDLSSPVPTARKHNSSSSLLQVVTRLTRSLPYPSARRHTSASSLLHDVTDLHKISRHRLYTMFGCLAEVIAWLHDVEDIRHRDLNAKQILLAWHGIWVADFGMSKERSEQSQSTTQSFHKSTPKYHAPERQNDSRCGKPEDVFALGCIFLEMAYRLCTHDLVDRIPPPYYAHLDQLDRWLRPLKSSLYSGKPELSQLADLIRDMMGEDASDRPIMRNVVTTLRAIKVKYSPNFFGSCCPIITSDPEENARVPPTGGCQPLSSASNESQYVAEGALAKTTMSISPTTTYQHSNPLVIKDTSRPKMWWIPSDGISREVITCDLSRYLDDPDALVRPEAGTGEYAGIPGYRITACRILTSQMIEALKMDSQRWQQERQSGEESRRVAYWDSQTYAARQHRGPSIPDSTHDQAQSRSSNSLDSGNQSVGVSAGYGLLPKIGYASGYYTASNHYPRHQEPLSVVAPTPGHYIAGNGRLTFGTEDSDSTGYGHYY